MSALQEQPCFDAELLSLMEENDVAENIVARSIIETKNLYNLANESGDTLLHFAAKYHNLVLIKYLIESGLEVNAKNNAGKTPIILALEDGSFGSIYLLATAEMLCEAGANIHIADNDGNSAARLVLDQNKFEKFLGEPVIVLFLQIIEREFSNDSKRIAEKLMSLNCPLWQAVYLKNPDVIEQMIKAGCSVNSCHPEFKFTALNLAVELVDLKMVELLVSCGADLNWIDRFGKSVLSSYCRICSDQIEDLKILKILLNGMTFRNVEDRLRNMNMIMRSGTKESIKALLEHDNNILNTRNSRGATPLHFLALNKNSNATEAMRGQHFDVNTRDVEGCSPLIMATLRHSCSHANTLIFLLDHGADVHVKSNSRVTPVMSLVAHGKQSKKELHKIIVMFLERNVDVQAIGSYETNGFHRNGPIINHESTLFDIIMMRETFYMAKPILAHLAMQEELGIDISDYIRYKIHSHQMFKNHFDLCKRKLKRMKNIVIKGKLTLFQILVGRGEQFVQWYVNRQDIIWKLENIRKKCRSKYYYDVIIRKRIPNVILKIQSICKGTPSLGELPGMKSNTNHIVVSKIIEY